MTTEPIRNHSSSGPTTPHETAAPRKWATSSATQRARLHAHPSVISSSISPSINGLPSFQHDIKDSLSTGNHKPSRSSYDRQSSLQRLDSPRYLARDRPLPYGAGKLAEASDSLFVIVSDDQRGDRRFVRVVPRDPAGLVEALARRVRNAYFDSTAALTRLNEAAAELTRFDGSHLTITEAEVQAALEEELDAVLPAEWKTGRPSQTATQRSELAEIIATDVVRTLFGTVVPASRIASKEIPDQQTRGADVLGIENLEDPVAVLIVGEVKGSCAANSPPGVVADMADKLVSLTSSRRALLQELIWLRDHSDDEHQTLCMKICSGFLLHRYSPKIILTPILLRTANTEGPGDHGKFSSLQENFDYPIRFIRVIVEVEDLLNLAVAIYREARKLTSQ